MATTPPNRSLQPTPDGAFSSAFAVHVIGPAWLSSIVRRDMKLHSILLGGTGFLTKPCVSPQVFHGSMRLAGWAEGPLLPEVWSLPGNVANLVASDRGRARIGGQGQTN